MEDLLGDSLRRSKDKIEIPLTDAFENKTLLALYFSGHWSPSCRLFDKRLEGFYN